MIRNEELRMRNEGELRSGIIKRNTLEDVPSEFILSGAVNPEYLPVFITFRSALNLSPQLHSFAEYGEGELCRLLFCVEY